jgi:nicotinamide-nucleotide amidase
MMAEPAVELLSIGNEILQGDILDTNAHWLCRQLVTRGARVTRITVLPDIPDVIGEALRASLARHPALIITCGGLGPTVDDLTMSAIGAALGRRVAESEDAYRLVADFYANAYQGGHVESPDMTSARRKMAVVPEGCELLVNRVGAAPGVLLREDTPGASHVLIASLPGVPEEMKAIFTESLWPVIADRFTGQVFVEREIPTDSHDESAMSAAVDQVTARHPAVYVKSRAQVYGGGTANFVTLSARAATHEAANRLLDAAEADLRTTLAAAGVHTGKP